MFLLSIYIILNTRLKHYHSTKTDKKVPPNFDWLCCVPHNTFSFIKFEFCPRHFHQKKKFYGHFFFIIQGRINSSYVISRGTYFDCLQSASAISGTEKRNHRTGTTNKICNSLEFWVVNNNNELWKSFFLQNLLIT